MYKKFEINWTIKGSCQSGRKVVTHDSKSDLPLGLMLILTYLKRLYLLSIRGCIHVHRIPGTFLTMDRPICINSGTWYCSLSSKFIFANQRVCSTESDIDLATLCILEIPWWRRKHGGLTQMSTWLWFFLFICSTSLQMVEANRS